jgi:caffeoyl-CoA O-methyltransferase
MPAITDPAIERYVTDHAPAESPVLAKIAAYTEEQTSAPQMMAGRFQGALLRLLVGLSGAKEIVEIGTFTGYSALAMAEALPEGGRVVTIDQNEETTRTAQSFWDLSPVGDRIDARVGSALAVLAEEAGPFDLAFIDADKIPYQDYYELCLPKLRAGGLILADNTLLSGQVLAPESESAKAIDQFNRHVANDPRVESVLLPVRDGLTLARKR